MKPGDTESIIAIVVILILIAAFAVFLILRQKREEEEARKRQEEEALEALFWKENMRPAGVRPEPDGSFFRYGRNQSVPGRGR